MTPKIGIPDTNLKRITKILNALLSDEYTLFTKTLNYHWNVQTLHFHDLHKFFDEQYHELLEIVDGVAERIRSLGCFALGSLIEFQKNTRLKEQAGKIPSAKQMIATLLLDHETIIRQLRTDLTLCDEKYGDIGTNDFLTGLMEKHEKIAWMLRSCL